MSQDNACGQNPTGRAGSSYTRVLPDNETGDQQSGRSTSQGRAVETDKEGSVDTRGLRGTEATVMANTRDFSSRAVENADCSSPGYCYSGDLNKVPENAGQNLPLGTAVYNGDIKLCERYIRAGADVNLKDTFGYYPIQLAIVAKQYDISKLLIEKGADISVRFPKSHYQEREIEQLEFTVRQYAMMYFPKLNKILKTRGITTPEPVEDGKRLLLVLKNIKSVESLLYSRTFIKTGADLDQMDENSATPLLLALEYLNLKHPGFPDKATRAKKIAELLIDNGADSGAQNAQGMTPLKFAMEEGMGELAFRMLCQDAAWGKDNINTALTELINLQNALTTRQQRPEENTEEPYKIATMQQLVDDYNKLISGMTLFDFGVIPDLPAMCQGLSRLWPKGSLSELIAHSNRPQMTNPDYVVKTRELLDQKDERGYTPLHYAVSAGVTGVIDTLLRMGADPDIKVSGEGGKTAQQLAEEGKLEDIGVMLKEWSLKHSALREQNRANQISRVPSLYDLVKRVVRENFLPQLMDHPILPKKVMDDLMDDLMDDPSYDPKDDLKDAQLDARLDADGAGLEDNLE